MKKFNTDDSKGVYEIADALWRNNPSIDCTLHECEVEGCKVGVRDRLCDLHIIEEAGGGYHLYEVLEIIKSYRSAMNLVIAYETKGGA